MPKCGCHPGGDHPKPEPQHECGETINSKYKFCPNCGKDLKPDLFQLIVRTDHQGLKEALDKYSYDLEVKNMYGNTPLIQACDLKCLELLLEHGADPNVTNNKGHSPLYLAAFFGRPDHIKKLLEHGAIATPPLRGQFPQYSALWDNEHTRILQLEKRVAKLEEQLTCTKIY